MSQRALHTYKKVFLESASKPKILDELFNRLIRDLDDASAAIAVKDLKSKGVALSHALAIVGELSATLDDKAAPELTKNLARLYDFTAAEISKANAQIDATPLSGARQIFVQL